MLLGEDKHVNQKVSLNLLQRIGLNADLANNGREAIDAMNNRQYALILMDVQMPVMDGLEATRHIRSNETNKNSPPIIIAMTANAMKGDREKCLSAGMNDYIAKPIRLNNLESILQKWMPIGQTHSASVKRK